jgi:hypothetical protein
MEHPTKFIMHCIYYAVPRDIERLVDDYSYKVDEMLKDKEENQSNPFLRYCLRKKMLNTHNLQH